jgi:hypothetical protein
MRRPAPRALLAASGNYRSRRPVASFLITTNDKLLTGFHSSEWLAADAINGS